MSLSDRSLKSQNQRTDDRKIQSQGQFLSISGFNARGTLSILVSITPRSLNLTYLQSLSEFCHFSRFNDKSQTKVKNSLNVNFS